MPLRYLKFYVFNLGISEVGTKLGRFVSLPSPCFRDTSLPCLFARLPMLLIANPIPCGRLPYQMAHAKDSKYARERILDHRQLRVLCSIFACNKKTGKKGKKSLTQLYAPARFTSTEGCKLLICKDFCWLGCHQKLGRFRIHLQIIRQSLIFRDAPHMLANSV